MLSSVALFSDLMQAYIEIGVALSLILYRSFHRIHWAFVMKELRDRTPLVVNDDIVDDGYQSESWDNECDDYAAFIDHRKLWAGVMTELGMVRPIERVTMEIAMGCNAMGQARQQPANVYAALVKHRALWPAVMQEMKLFKSRSQIEMEMLWGFNDKGEIAIPRSVIEMEKACRECSNVVKHPPVQRPTKLIDRRGKSLPPLNLC
ncbi:hypothetical protein LSAT2_015281 [Lamellibrachia satsuma]|nr:hypothetical protein LSAT2_015281 [Lamellibrachia satsuma]